ncbi:helix-turn-helix domain-containing protein [Enterococcus sp. LJL51]|uniref:helix-turn-helix domain-containing protein n=1 Tax=Enterococcus sp. LJL51 TaxID=3416656 RepID=UPI003CEADA72
MELGEKLKVKRQEFNFTQQDLADKLHVSRQTISNWEVSRSYPDIESLIQLSEIFSVSLDVLLKGDQKMIISLKRKNLLEVLYMVFNGMLAVSILLCMSIDFIYSRSLTWSLIVMIGCLIAGAAIAVFRYCETMKLVKASAAVSLLLVPLMIVIQWQAPYLELSQLLMVTGIWTGYYWAVLLLWTLTSINFWQLLVFALLLSFGCEWAAIYTAGETVQLSTFLIQNLVELLLTGLFAFFGIIKIDKGRMTKILSEYKRI